VRAAPAIVFGLLAAAAHLGARAFFASYDVVGSGDANAAYAGAALAVSTMLWIAICVALLQFAAICRARARAIPLLLILFALAACACAVGTVTFFVVPLVFGAVALYALPASAGRSAPDALAESCRVAIGAPGPTALALLVLATGFAVALVAGGLLGSVQPLVGDLFAGLASQFAMGLAAPGIVATYLKLQPRPEVS